VLANLAVASFGHLVQVIRHGLKKIQYRPGLIEGCLAGTGLALEPGETPVDHELNICKQHVKLRRAPSGWSPA
jgi:hypothetical protein